MRLNDDVRGQFSPTFHAAVSTSMVPKLPAPRNPETAFLKLFTESESSQKSGSYGPLNIATTTIRTSRVPK